MKNIHEYQRKILTSMLFKQNSSFADLKQLLNVENNLLVYHLDQLVADGHCEKSVDGYVLTLSGKEYANRLDTDDTKVVKQGKIATINCCVKQEGGKWYLLLYTRKKHPFFGGQGFPTGKVQYGESVFAAAQRELTEETALTGAPQLFMIEHHLVFDQTKQNLLEDKYFYFMLVVDPQGELTPNPEGDFVWVEYSKLKEYIIKPFESVEREIYIADRAIECATNLKGDTVSHGSQNTTFEEIIHVTDQF